eukprot:CAMPEP_0194198968 /NCGR_PEP_ID=MMETSP0156-20130528/165_1 /TAXON_ID=33649 /ORGANISM="Thalassionema nitzschioides, Strain L26-B" /LENGTH=272 /DNA_ID=CAMNT_0038923801 /DNA_START=87 /DNA_END=905 /DNA_ORIENTATION=+
MDFMANEAAFNNIPVPNKTSVAFDSSNLNIGLKSVMYPELVAGDFKKISTKKFRKRPKEKSDKPKRALSAYNLFFQSERVKILNETSQPRHKPRRSHGKIGFAALARSVADKWKTLPAKEKAKFETVALKEKERYEKEVEVWNQMRVAKMASNHEITSANNGNPRFPCELQSLTSNDTMINEIPLSPSNMLDRETDSHFQTQGNTQVVVPHLYCENNNQADSINISDCDPLDRNYNSLCYTSEKGISTFDNECLDILAALKNLGSSDLNFIH